MCCCSVFGNVLEICWRCFESVVQVCCQIWGSCLISLLGASALSMILYSIVPFLYISVVRSRRCIWIAVFGSSVDFDVLRIVFRTIEDTNKKQKTNEKRQPVLPYTCTEFLGLVLNPSFFVVLLVSPSGLGFVRCWIKRYDIGLIHPLPPPHKFLRHSTKSAQE